MLHCCESYVTKYFILLCSQLVIVVFLVKMPHVSVQQQMNAVI